MKIKKSIKEGGNITESDSGYVAFHNGTAELQASPLSNICQETVRISMVENATFIVQFLVRLSLTGIPIYKLESSEIADGADEDIKKLVDQIINDPAVASDSWNYWQSVEENIERFRAMLDLTSAKRYINKILLPNKLRKVIVEGEPQLQYNDKMCGWQFTDNHYELKKYFKRLPDLKKELLKDLPTTKTYVESYDVGGYRSFSKEGEWWVSRRQGTLTTLTKVAKVEEYFKISMEKIYSYLTVIGATTTDDPAWKASPKKCLKDGKKAYISDCGIWGEVLFPKKGKGTYIFLETQWQDRDACVVAVDVIDGKVRKPARMNLYEYYVNSYRFVAERK